jgi:hypothetical protein
MVSLPSMPRPTLATHPRSFWRDRTPSFDGLHATDFPEGYIFQNNALQNFMKLNGTWVEVGEEEWEKPLPKYIPPPSLPPPPPPVPPKRSRGRPPVPKRGYNLQNPSKWSQFLSEQMKLLSSNPMTSQEKMSFISRLWRDQKKERIQICVCNE